MAYKTSKTKIGVAASWIESALREQFHYPEDFVRERLRLEKGNTVDSHIDTAFLVTETDYPFLAVVGVAPSALALGEARLSEILSANRFLGCGVVTDGTAQGSRFFRKNFFSGEVERMNELGVYSAPVKTDQLYARSNTTKHARILSKLSSNVEGIFFQAHSHIRDIDGLHPEEALDELSKVLHLKIADETGNAADPFNIVQRTRYGATEEFACRLREAYAKSITRPGARSTDSSGLGTIRLSSAALSKTVEEVQDYSFTASDVDVKGRAFQRMLGSLARAGMGQYLTPDPVVRFMVAAASPTDSEYVIDPFSGSAHFLVTSARHMGGSLSAHKDNLFGIEKNERMLRIGRIDLELHGISQANLILKDALLDFSNYPDIGSERFDVVLTNPPFGSLLGETALQQLGRFDLCREKKSTPLEILGLERSIQLLRPGGRLAIVIPESLLSNRNTSYVRDWLSANVKLRAIISLPIETFAPFGANVKTSILLARKAQKAELLGDYPIFLATCENIGYDSSGRPREGADISDVLREFKEFIKANHW